MPERKATVLLEHHLEAVAQVNFERPGVPVHTNGNRRNGQQAVMVNIQSAGFHIQHHPSRLVDRSSKSETFLQ